MCSHLLERVIVETNFTGCKLSMALHAGKLYDKFLVQCLKLLRQVLKCEDYQVSTTLLSSGESCLSYNNAYC